MNANAKCKIRELNADELGLVGGGNGITRGLAAVGWSIGVAGDYYFGAGNGYFFHGSPEERQWFIGD